MVDGIEIGHGSRQGSLDDACGLWDTTPPVLLDLEMYASPLIFGYLDTLVEVSSVLGQPFQESRVCPQGVVAGGSVSFVRANTDTPLYKFS